MVNHCIRIGIENNNVSTLKKLSLLSYNQLKVYQITSCYKLHAISQACGRLAQMKRSIRKGAIPKSPYVRKPYLVSSYRFKINGMLLSIPICGDRLQEDIFQHRKLWCNNCKKSIDRDVVASLNISYKGCSRFWHPRGLSGEAVKGNADNLQPLILRVDGSKLICQTTR